MPKTVRKCLEKSSSSFSMRHQALVLAKVFLLQETTHWMKALSTVSVTKMIRRKGCHEKTEFIHFFLLAL